MGHASHAAPWEACVGARHDRTDGPCTVDPWLTIPSSAYEGHTARPGVQQSQFLSQVFRDEQTALRPQTLAVLECATGNGIEHIDPAVTRRAVGVHINSPLLEALSGRFGPCLPGLRLVCADVLDMDFAECSFDLIHWALIYSRRRFRAP